MYRRDHIRSIVRGPDPKPLIYFALGQTRVNEHPIQPITYQFTGKEIDQETGLYYFGARYLDPRTSLWISADPALEDYLPGIDRENESALPGFGGIYNSSNLALYSYSQQNPILYVDPDGRFFDETGRFLGRVGTEVGKRTVVGWGGALREPSPFGEAVMLVVTVGVTGYAIYAVATAPAEEPADEAAIETGTTTTTRTRREDQNIVRLQVQVGNENISSTTAINTPETGVLKAQAFGGLLTVYNEAVAKQPAPGRNAGFRSAVIRLSRRVRDLQGGLLPGPYQTDMQETFEHSGRTYRIDLENISGHNLRE